MRAILRRIRILSGYLLIVAGVLGCLLPVIPGAPMLVAGAALLGPHHPLVRGGIDRFERWREQYRQHGWRSFLRKSRPSPFPRPASAVEDEWSRR